MLCKRCGRKITRRDRRVDGLYQCPGCGKLYREKPGARGRRRLRVRGLTVAAVALVAALIAAVALYLALRAGSGDRRAAESAASPTATLHVASAATAAPTPTPPPAPPASVRFRAAGDVMVHKLQLSHARQSDGSYNFDSQFMYVRDALSRADYTIVNLETSISADGEYGSYPRFRSPESLLATLQDCGVDMLTMANNHILDGYYPGLVASLDAADRCGLAHVGAYRTEQEAAEPLVVDINGIRFGFLAYTVHTNENEAHLDASQARYCVKRLEGADFESDVRALREMGAEVVICLPHWGEEGSHAPNAECKSCAREMVEAGVDIILGSHPHIVQPIYSGRMEVDGREKDVLIAWSMGNFISYMAAEEMDCGIIVDFTVSRDEGGEIHIQDVGYVPVYVCGSQRSFHLVCSGDFYDSKPSGMTDSQYSRMRESVREIASTVGQDGIEMLRN